MITNVHKINYQRALFAYQLIHKVQNWFNRLKICAINRLNVGALNLSTPISSCPVSEHGRNYRQSQISERLARFGV